MVGWHHRLNGHELGWTLGGSGGQGGLACCGPWIAEGRTWLSDGTTTAARTCSADWVTRCVPEGRLGYGVADAPQTKGHQTMKILFLVHPTYLLSLAGGLWSKSSSSSLPDGGEGTRPITKTEKKENTAKLLLALKAVQEWRVSHPLTFHWPNLAPT